MIFIWWKLKMSYHTAYPNWDSLAVVCHLFLYLFICGPTTTFTGLSKFCTSQLSSIFYLSQEALSCRVSFLKGTYNFQLFKNAFCKGACTLKCTEKRFIPFASLICPPTHNSREALHTARWMYCTIHLLEIIRLSDFSSPLFYPSLLGGERIGVHLAGS